MEHSHFLVVGLSVLGAAHSHVPAGVAMVLGGQQTLFGPVTVVPSGQHIENFEVKDHAFGATSQLTGLLVRECFGLSEYDKCD